MNSMEDNIKTKGNDVVVDNNFLFEAFEGRLVLRLSNIFDKYKIPINRNMLTKNIEENLINHLTDMNEEIIDKYIKLLVNYEKIISSYVSNRADTETIKKSTMSFINKISEKNKTFVTINVANNFIEYINSIIYVYDNRDLNEEVINRINIDIKEIINEFNRNNYNFVIESINEIIKNIIKNM